MIEVEIAGKKISLHEHPTIWMPAKITYLMGPMLNNFIESDMKVLEMGVGSGALAVLAGIKGAFVTGLDIHPDAPGLSYENWKLNGLDPSRADFRHSDIFSALKEEEEASFDIFWSNIPTFPGKPEDRVNRQSRDAYGTAGPEGREMLDAMICHGPKWLCPGGKMITVAHSKQGWRKTQTMMDNYWKKWRIILEKEVPLASYYKPYIEFWLEKNEQDNEIRIFQKGDQWFQRLYFIEGTK